MLLAFAIGAVGNVVGSALNGVDAVWDIDARRLPADHPGQHPRPAGRLHARRADPQHTPARSSRTSSTRSCCRRSSASWPRSRTGSRTSSRGSTSASRRRRCSRVTSTGEQWAQLGVSGMIWLVIPLADRRLGGSPLRGEIGPGHRQVGENGDMRKRVAILGSTGSIGTQALEVVAANPDRFEVVALAAGGNDPALLAAQALEHEVAVVARRQGERGPGRPARALRRGAAPGLRARATTASRGWSPARTPPSTSRARRATSCSTA